MRWWAAHTDAWNAARAHPRPSQTAIPDFVAWTEGLRNEIGWPVMVAFPAAFDAMWVEWYCHRFVGASPFRRRCVDLRTLAMVAMGAGYREAGKTSMPQHWRTGTGTHSHLALDDATEQGRLFFRIARELGVQRGDVALALEPPSPAAPGGRDFLAPAPGGARAKAALTDTASSPTPRTGRTNGTHDPAVRRDGRGSRRRDDEPMAQRRGPERTRTARRAAHHPTVRRVARLARDAPAQPVARGSAERVWPNSTTGVLRVTARQVTSSSALAHPVRSRSRGMTPSDVAGADRTNRRCGQFVPIFDSTAVHAPHWAESGR